MNAHTLQKSILGVVVLAAMSCTRGESGSQSANAPTPASAPASATTGAVRPDADYQAVEVRDGGAIAVTVMHAGQPKQVRAEVTRDQETCGSAIATPVTEVGQGGLLKNAVVYIENIRRGKAPDLAFMPRLDNQGCHFLPHVQTLTVGQMLEITNSDPILHNSHAYAGNRTIFNVALPIQGQRISRKITVPGPMHIQCDAGHTWMEAWIYAFPHPYHAVTGADGKAVITDVPPGTYQVAAWHQEVGTQTGEVTVDAGRTIELELSRLAKPAAQREAAAPAEPSSS